MKKTLIILTACLVAVISLVSVFATSVTPVTQQVSAISFSEIAETTSIQPFAANDGGAWDVVDTPIYSKSFNSSNIVAMGGSGNSSSDQQIYYSEEFGILMTADYEPIADTSGANTLVAAFDISNQATGRNGLYIVSVRNAN